MVVVKFVSIIGKKEHVRNAVVIEFVYIIRENKYVKNVAEVQFVSIIVKKEHVGNVVVMCHNIFKSQCVEAKFALIIKILQRMWWKSS